MSKVNINGVWKDIDKAFVNIGGIWKEVEKMFCNIGGVWKEVEGLTKILEYFGTATNLSRARVRLASASVGNYALFAGGDDSVTIGNYLSYNTVDAYNSTLVRSIPTALSTQRGWLAGGSTNDYALFAGGGSKITNENQLIYNTVDAYNSTLVRSTPTTLSESKFGLSSANVGDYVMFVGGKTSWNGSSYSADAYNNSLVRTVAPNTTNSAYNMASASVGNYALFAGGSQTQQVSAYNTSLVKSTPTELSTYVGEIVGASVGNYALISTLSWNGSSSDSVVQVYTNTLVKTTPTALSSPRNNTSSLTVNDYALFAGGNDMSTGSRSNTVDEFNKSLVRKSHNSMDVSRARHSMKAGIVGDYILFAGGYTNTTQYLVDVYQLK